MQYKQEPMAIVGFACRLPGRNNSEQTLWDFLERGDIASCEVPKSRFNIDGHFDGSRRPGTMRPPGAMFLSDIDLAEFDASFFEIGGTEAIAMDPNQRQMLEVVFEALENSGLTLENLSGASVGCFVGSFASDYADMQSRDPEDRPANNAVGVGRAILANRLSYFLNVKGPSITIDTACSGSLVGLDLACRSLQSGETEAAIVAASNIYLGPEHQIDVGSMVMAYSPTGRCHTFDAAADGYAKAEAVSCIILKRLPDAIRDRDPVRAIVRGTASNSNGRTAGIAGPSSDAQAAAIRRAYANAGITDLNETGYLECHGTGTQAGDPTEVTGAGSVFAPTRDSAKPLVIGSIKSNIGHSEPAAGNSGLIKVVMSMERGVIPGTPSFVNPNPQIDFERNKVKAIRRATKWPDNDYAFRRSSINSFGFGGSNAHAIVEQPSFNERRRHTSSYEESNDDNVRNIEGSGRPYVCVTSANDGPSLQANIRRLCAHLVNPRVNLDLADLAYTLSERRSHLWYRAFITTSVTVMEEKDFAIRSKSGSNMPKIAMIFTGQGAQWSQMGRAMLQKFPFTRSLIQEMDRVLQAIPDRPDWSIVAELTEFRTPEHLRQPELSQTLVTALQICILAILSAWGIKPSSVVGHSSGEIAAAYAAGFLDRDSAILAAFYRGRAANCVGTSIDREVGMLAVGLSAADALPFLKNHGVSASIACFNSPKSVTISGKKAALEIIRHEIEAAGHFARSLLVNLAYHSHFMSEIGEEYYRLLCLDERFRSSNCSSDTTLYSSVTASTRKELTDSTYWKSNMMEPVQFEKALEELVLNEAPSILIEVGPSSALAGPVSQVLQALQVPKSPLYLPTWSRKGQAAKPLIDIAGHIFLSGAPIDFKLVNAYDVTKVRTIVDLPNYSWNHSVKYWHENSASKDWRFKKFVTHELLGSKIPGTLWSVAPTWRKHLTLADVPWLRDHRMGPDILMPGAGYVTLALEAMYQTQSALYPDAQIKSPNELAYRFRNIKFERAMVFEEETRVSIVLSLAKVHGSIDWYEFRVMTSSNNVAHVHCTGMVRIQEPLLDEENLTGTDTEPLKYPQPAWLWYKAQREAGFNFGPSFRTLKSIESVSGSRQCRVTLSLESPASSSKAASYYPLHPTVLDSCFNSVTPASAGGDRSSIRDIMIPAMIDDIVINEMPKTAREGLAVANSEYTGRGREDTAKSWIPHTSVHDLVTKRLIMRMSGLRYVKLDVEEKPDPHVFQTTTWKPDMTYLEKNQLIDLLPTDSNANRIAAVVDLIAWRKPALKVLEVNIVDTKASSIWFQDSENVIRAAYSQYDYLSTNSTNVIATQEAFHTKKNADYHLLHSVTKVAEALALKGPYDLAILKLPTTISAESRSVFKDIGGALEGDGLLLCIGQHGECSDSDVLRPDTEKVIKTSHFTQSSSATPVDDASSFASQDAKLPGHTPSGHPEPDAWVDKDVLDPFVQVSGGSDMMAAGLYKRKVLIGTQPRHRAVLNVVQFEPSSSSLLQPLRNVFEESGWVVEPLPVERIKPGSDQDLLSVALVLEELSDPLLTRISDSQWRSLQLLINIDTPILWVTLGGQTSHVTDPSRALAQGLFRTVRAERPDARVTVLDVQSPANSGSTKAINKILQSIRRGTDLETEYAERAGIIHVQRLTLDKSINRFKDAENGKSQELVTQGLAGATVPVRLQAEKVGSLESLTWCQTDTEVMPVDPEHVEIEVIAVPVNFKDLATTMGLVPENEHAIGCECAGRVRRVAPGVTDFKVGDRVVAMMRGTYTNRVQCATGRVHIIPDEMSYEDAATLPLVNLTAIYALYRIANIKEGQTVLIHSAAGGVGIAAIQLAQHRKAEIFVTVSTDEKRKFLAERHGIAYDHMSSSRSAGFANEIRQRTQGRGVDVILNSLAGELLDESWRLLADGGIMLEIGKRDIVERNVLAMEPFDRNCSFHALDLSYVKHINDELFGSLLRELFLLVREGHVKPIRPLRVFRYDEVISALNYMRQGQHMGKIVVSRENEEDVKLPVKPAIRTLRLQPDASYLIVGGLKGLCGSIAVHLARHGARNLIVMSRSGTQDAASAKIINDCGFFNCKVHEAKGDVSDAEFVRRIFESSQPRIVGVIQGAMVLRDKPFEMMSCEDFHSAIRAKVVGTWNLHTYAERALGSPLHFFTVLSSVSGVVGNKGQANYAAANTFLDSFAQYRQSIGLRANAIDLGAIEDVGYIAEQGGTLEARFNTRQWTPINERVLRKIVSYSILQQSSTGPLSTDSSAQIITGIAYPLISDDSPLFKDRRFAYLFDSHSDEARDIGINNGSNIDQEIKAFRKTAASGAGDEVLSQALLMLLKTQLMRLLRLETEPEAGKPLMAYGLDSLSAVELRSWVRQKLGAELSTLDITNASSLTALSDKLVSRLPDLREMGK